MSLLFAALNQAAQDHRAAVAAQQGSTYAPRVAVAPSRQNWINLGLVLLTGVVGGAALVIVLVAQQPTYSVRDLTNNSRNSVWETAVPATPASAPETSPLAATRLPPARYTPTVAPQSAEAAPVEPTVAPPDTQYGIAINNAPALETTAPVAAVAPPALQATPAIQPAAAAQPVAPIKDPVIAVEDNALPIVAAIEAPKPQAKISVLMARAPKVKPADPVAPRVVPPAGEDGAAALARGDANAALMAYQSVLDRNPTDKAAQIGKAMALEQSGATSVALAQWRLLANQYPDDTAIMTSYARGLATVDAGTARALLQQVLARAPQFSPALAALAAIDAKAGNMDAAQDGQQRAWSLDKANPAHRLNLAIIADKRGEKAQALELYKQAQAAFANGGWKATMPMSWPAVQARVDYLTDYLARLPSQSLQRAQ